MRVLWALAASTTLAAASAGALPREIILPVEEFRDRLRGGWAGQMIGVSYGSVYEFVSNGKPILSPLRAWKPEYVGNSIFQDDIYVEMTFLKTLERHGIRPTHAQAGGDFRDSLYPLWHANMAARTNLKAGILPPRSGHPRWNPHADDIDFQIEADLFGLIAPGLPRACGRLCDVFGSIMNYGDGLYGGQFVAGMYTQAYLEKEPTPAAVRRCIDAGLAMIPPASDYAKILRDVIRLHAENPGDWLKTWTAIEEKWAADDLCPEGQGRAFNIDAKLNGAYIALGLLYGEADFEKTLEITTRCGQDADCNPSNAAGVLGTLLGHSRIPSQFTEGIPALTGRKFQFTDYDYPELVAACERVARRLIQASGGRAAVRDGREVLIIPEQRPAAPRRAERMADFPREDLRRWAEEFEQRRRDVQAKSIPVERWCAGWRIAALGAEMEPGVRRVFGVANALVTHPVSRREPAVLERRVALPPGRPALVLRVASFDGDQTADWLLRVLVDGQVAKSETVRSPGRWTEVTVDLSRWAGREVRLRLENAAGGASEWSWEAGYWQAPEIRTE